MAIVVVDDSLTTLLVLKGLCTKEKWPTVPFTSAHAALDQLRQTFADVIVVDWDMPEINGMKFISEVRRMPFHSQTPIIMVTHAKSLEIRREALEAGATEFLTKPIVAQEFKLRIKNLISPRGGYTSETQLAAG